MLTIVADLGSRQIGLKGQVRKFSLVRCDCGIEFELQSYRVNSTTTRCKHCSSTTHGKHKHRLYLIYDGMIQRTENINHINYDKYGGRGISICNDWCSNFMEFYTWSIKNGYSDELSIDRIDNNGNYSPDNCRWTTHKVQSRNTRRLRSNNTSGFRGVYRSKTKFVSKIMVNYKSVTIGTFCTALEAALAYDTYIIDNKLEHTTNFKINGDINE